MKPETYTYGAQSVLNTCDYERSGYDFIGWSTTQNGSVIYLDGGNFMVNNKNEVFYAQWKAKVVSLTLYGNVTDDLESDPTIEQLAVVGTQVKLNPNTFQKLGYRFVGWGVDPNQNDIHEEESEPDPDPKDPTYEPGTESPEDEFSFLSDEIPQGVIFQNKDTILVPPREVILYALWEVDETYLKTNNLESPEDIGTGAMDTVYTVTFSVNGNQTTQEVTEQERVVKPQNPSKSRYYFTGWFTDQACNNPYDFNEPVVSEFTLYAGFTNTKYTVTF